MGGDWGAFVGVQSRHGPQLINTIVRIAKMRSRHSNCSESKSKSKTFNRNSRRSLKPITTYN